MTPETWTVTAVAIAGLFIRMDTRLGRLDGHVRGQGEQPARLEGKVDTLIAAFVNPRTDDAADAAARRKTTPGRAQAFGI